MQYVDTLVSSGITYHTPVKYEVPDTTGNLTATYNNGTAGVGATLTNAGTQVAFTPDGVVATAGDRVLVYNQTNAIQNGVYTVTTVGSGSTNWVLTRATDADTYGLKDPDALGNGDAFFVSSGNTGAGETYVCNTVGVITFGTTNITFTQISSSQVYNAGTGLTLSPATTFNIANTTVTAASYGAASKTLSATVNAQGQLTALADTDIAIAMSQVTSGTLAATQGGTGQSSYAVGDILYADTTTSLARLADIATGNVLISGGISAAPAWGKVALASAVSGTLGIANGGTSATTQQGAIDALAGAVTSGYYLRGNGTNVSMAAIQAADVPTLNQDTTGTAAKTNALNSATTVVNVSSSSAPTAGQALIATSGTAATWQDIASGASITNDTTTASTLYPLFAATTTGTPTTVYTSNAKYLYQPSTGELSVTAPLAVNGLVLNNMTVNTSYSIPSGYSASSVGPVTIAAGVTVTIPAGSRWLIL